jgi:hypothetical protein
MYLFRVDFGKQERILWCDEGDLDRRKSKHLYALLENIKLGALFFWTVFRDRHSLNQ